MNAVGSKTEVESEQVATVAMQCIQLCMISSDKWCV